MKRTTTSASSFADAAFTSSFASTLGLFLLALPALHILISPEFMFPLSAGCIVNYVLNGMIQFEMPDPEMLISATEIEEMFEESVAALEPRKQDVGRDFMFLLTLEQRQGSGGLVACAMAAAYASTLSLDQRHPLHFLFLVMSILMTMINLNHIGLPFGRNPNLTENGELLGMYFAPYWVFASYFNYRGFADSRSRLAFEKDKAS